MVKKIKNATVSGVFRNDSAIIYQSISNCRPIFHSVVCKLERQAFRRGHLTNNPYIFPYQDQNSPSYCLTTVKGIYGFLIYKAVIVETMAHRGFKVTVTAQDGNYMTNGKHINLRIKFHLDDVPPLEDTFELPILETPVWHPKINGGCWTIFERHHGRCWGLTMQLIRQVGMHIRNHLHSVDRLRTMGDSWRVLPTKHVRRMTGVDNIEPWGK